MASLKKLTVRDTNGTRRFVSRRPTLFRVDPRTKSKVLAAHRAGFKKIICPKQNERDLPEIPEAVRNDLEFILAEDMREVLAAALEADPVAPETGSGSRPGTGGSAPVVA